MLEKDLIGKIQELGQIKPRKDWVVLTKKEILGKEPQKLDFSLLFQFGLEHKPIFASLVALAILIGVFGFAQNSLPGDFLYSLKKVTEKSQAVFVSEEEKPKVQLELVNKRLAELTKIAKENQVKKLAPALEEFQASVVQAAENLVKIKDSPELKREIVQQTKKIEEQKEKVEKLGIVIGGTEELDNALGQIVAEEIENLESSLLSQTQEELLEIAKQYYQEGRYSEALEKILFLSYPQQ